MKTLLGLSICIVMILALAAPLLADAESASDLSSVGIQVKEVSLGDLVADAVRSKAGTPVAIVAAGGFKEITIPAGTVSADSVLKCLQYADDKLVVIEITGEKLLSALERSVGINPQKSMGFLQVSGMSLTFDPDKTKGSRITAVKVGKEGLSKDRKYRIATTERLASGDYGYFTVWGKNLPKQEVVSSISDAVTGFLNSRDSVNYRKQDRIVLE